MKETGVSSVIDLVKKVNLNMFLYIIYSSMCDQHLKHNFLLAHCKNNTSS